MDDNICFKTHFQKVKGKAYKRMNIPQTHLLKTLGCSFPSPQCNCQCCVCKFLTAQSPAFFTLANKSDKKTMEVVFHAACRVANWPPQTDINSSSAYRRQSYLPVYKIQSSHIHYLKFIIGHFQLTL